MGKRAHLRISVRLVLAAILLLGASAFSAPAIAQERTGFGWSLRELLFPRRSERVRPPADLNKPRPKRKKATPQRSAAPAPVAPPVVKKEPDARVVLVVGDFMAGGLAEGLETIFAENPKVAVVNRTKGSSGLVRDDFYDWPREIGAILEEEKPAVVVVMLGSNDRQEMRIGETREVPRSDAWTKEYEARVAALGKSIAAGKVPLLWVGQPAFKSAKMTSDMLAFNAIYRDAAQATGGEFIDIWDGFTDENGAFVTTGPDVNGQPVRLRASDGINMTAAGKHKMAFYAEKPLLKILGLSTTDGSPARFVPAGLPAETAPEDPATPTDRTPPILLRDPALDGGSELLGALPPAPGIQPNSPSARNGPASEPNPGRADDFSWPPHPGKDVTEKPAPDKAVAVRP